MTTFQALVDVINNPTPMRVQATGSGSFSDMRDAQVRSIARQVIQALIKNPPTMLSRVEKATWVEMMRMVDEEGRRSAEVAAALQDLTHQPRTNP